MKLEQTAVSIPQYKTHPDFSSKLYARPFNMSISSSTGHYLIKRVGSGCENTFASTCSFEDCGNISAILRDHTLVHQQDLKSLLVHGFTKQFNL